MAASPNVIMHFGGGGGSGGSGDQSSANTDCVSALLSNMRVQCSGDVNSRPQLRKPAQTAQQQSRPAAAPQAPFAPQQAQAPQGKQDLAKTNLLLSLLGGQGQAQQKPSRSPAPASGAGGYSSVPNYAGANTSLLPGSGPLGSMPGMPGMGMPGMGMPGMGMPGMGMPGMGMPGMGMPGMGMPGMPGAAMPGGAMPPLPNMADPAATSGRAATTAPPTSTPQIVPNQLLASLLQAGSEMKGGLATVPAQKPVQQNAPADFQKTNLLRGLLGVQLGAGTGPAAGGGGGGGVSAAPAPPVTQPPARPTQPAVTAKAPSPPSPESKPLAAPAAQSTSVVTPNMLANLLASSATATSAAPTMKVVKPEPSVPTFAQPTQAASAEKSAALVQKEPEKKETTAPSVEKDLQWLVSLGSKKETAVKETSPASKSSEAAPAPTETTTEEARAPSPVKEKVESLDFAAKIAVPKPAKGPKRLYTYAFLKSIQHNSECSTAPEGILPELRVRENDWKSDVRWKSLSRNTGGDKAERHGPQRATVSYSAVELDKYSQLCLRTLFFGQLPDEWEKHGQQMLICQGPLSAPKGGEKEVSQQKKDEIMKLKAGQEVTLKVDAKGSSKMAWAVKVSGCVSGYPTAHITLALAPDTKPSASIKITKWEELSAPMNVTGHIKEYTSPYPGNRGETQAEK